MRFSATSHGVVYTPNITPDPTGGLGTWTDDQIVEVLRSGKRPDGTALFLFPPHSFFKNLALDDAHSLVAYLRTLKPVEHAVPVRELPFEPPPATDVTHETHAPIGRTPERATYLLSALIGCRECHSHTKDGTHHEYVGGDPADPFTGVFRLGPDLPLRASERGLANFPYPGFAVLYAGNLTRYGRGGDLASSPRQAFVDAMRLGVSPRKDRYGRPIPLGHVMLWQFYSQMVDDDAYAIAELIANQSYVAHDVPPLRFYGTDWALAFRAVYAQPPSPEDATFFGKSL